MFPFRSPLVHSKRVYISVKLKLIIMTFLFLITSYFHLYNCASKYVNSTIKNTLKYMNVSQHVKEVNPYLILPLLEIWAFCNKISPLLWKEELNKFFFFFKWSTLYLCPSPLHHVIQMPIFLFLAMVFFFYTCDPWCGAGKFSLGPNLGVHNIRKSGMAWPKRFWGGMLWCIVR